MSSEIQNPSNDVLAVILGRLETKVDSIQQCFENMNNRLTLIETGQAVHEAEVTLVKRFMLVGFTSIAAPVMVGSVIIILEKLW